MFRATKILIKKNLRTRFDTNVDNSYKEFIRKSR